jgi:transposase-like protein
MKNINAKRDVLQERTEELMNRFTSDDIVGSLASPDDLREYLEKGFSALLNTAMLKERELYLQDHPEDRANGYAPQRSLKVKTTPVDVERPRTRGDFYPAMLPRYQRHIPSEYQNMLERILLDAKSFSSALRTMKALGMSYSERELESLLGEIETEAESFHNRRLDPDWIVLYIDAKVIDLKDEHNHVKKAVHFLVVGINFEGRKEIICSRIYWGNEKIECWKSMFIDLKKRGLTRVLLLVTDAFSGLKKLIEGFWSLSDHQLCTVHLLRNAHRQLSSDDYADFTQTWSEIIASSSLETAREKWLALLDRLICGQSA